MHILEGIHRLFNYLILIIPFCMNLNINMQARLCGRQKNVMIITLCLLWTLQNQTFTSINIKV
jgi:hypothetical protein